MKSSLFILAWIGCLCCAQKLLRAHEGHQPLPTRGIQIDRENGRLTLSRDAGQILGIQTELVETGKLTDTISAYATVVVPWKQHAFATSRLAGRVSHVAIQPGDRVTAGQKLATIQSRELQALKADYETSLNDLALSKGLIRLAEQSAVGGGIAAQRLSELETTQKQNENALAILDTKLASLGLTPERLLAQSGSDELEVIAPITGTVVHSDVTVGEFIEPTQHLIEIMNLESVWLRIDVLEKDLARVAKGQLVRFRPIESNLPMLETRIDRIGKFLDPLRQMSSVWCSVQNSTAMLSPGMKGRCEIIMDGSPSESQSLIVPMSAIQSDGAERYVFVESAMTIKTIEFKKATVIPRRYDASQAEVLTQEVYPGDRVLTRGSHELSSLFILGELRLKPETASAMGLKTTKASVRPIDRVLHLDAFVDLTPQARTTASSIMSGKISAIHVDRGQIVEAGELLAEVSSLEVEDLYLDMIRSRLNANLWKETGNKLRLSSNVTSRRNQLEIDNKARDQELRFENIWQQLKSIGFSTNRLNQAIANKSEVGTIPIVAPTKGTVVQFDRVVGQVVRANEGIFEVHDESAAQIRAFLPQREFSKISIGQKARLQLVAYPGQVFQGHVARIGPVIASSNQNIPIWIELDRTNVPLQYRMMARVSLVQHSNAKVLAVPNSSIIQDGLKRFAFVFLPSGTFARRLVKVGQSDDQFTQVLQGIALEDEVVTQGVQSLQTAFSLLR